MGTVQNSIFVGDVRPEMVGNGRTAAADNQMEISHYRHIAEVKEIVLT